MTCRKDVGLVGGDESVQFRDAFERLVDVVEECRGAGVVRARPKEEIVEHREGLEGATVQIVERGPNVHSASAAFPCGRVVAESERGERPGVERGDPSIILEARQRDGGFARFQRHWS